MKYAIIDSTRVYYSNDNLEAIRLRKTLNRETSRRYIILKCSEMNVKPQEVIRNYAIVSTNSKEIPGEIVKVGKMFESGLLRCTFNKKVYNIHKKFLTFK